MILTLTPNPAIDKTLWLPCLHLGSTNRVHRNRTDPGGKGVNFSKVLHRLGLPSLIMGWTAGESGALLESLLQRQGLQTALTPIQGQTRTNLKLLAQEETEINEPGTCVSPCDVSTLKTAFKEHCHEAQWAVMAGSLPPGAPADLYRDLIEVAHSYGLQVLLDTSGEALAMGLEARPTLVKPNRQELQGLTGMRLEHDEEILHVLQSLEVPWAICSLGSDGCIALTPQGAWRLRPPKLSVVSTVGAGDTMVAAILWGWVHRLPPLEILCTATALSAASTLSERPGDLDLNLLDEILPLVDVLRL